MIADAIEALFEKVGYRIACAGGGKETVQLVEQGMNDIKMVILDILMPDMDGRKTFHRIKKIQPKLPVLMASGYNHQEQISDILQHGAHGFIQKPYTISQILPTIQSILAEAQSAPDDGLDC